MTYKSIERVIANIVNVDGLCPCLTANAMQSINHQNCVLIVVKGEQKWKSKDTEIT